MPNVVIDEFHVNDPLNHADNTNFDGPLSESKPSMIETKTSNRKKKENPGTVKSENGSSTITGKKRTKKNAPSLDDPELIAVEALAFMFAGNPPANGNTTNNTTVQPSSDDSLYPTYPFEPLHALPATTSAPKRMRTSSGTTALPGIMNTGFPSGLPSGMTFPTNALMLNSFLLPPSTTNLNSYNINNLSNNNNNNLMMNVQALTEADRVISGTVNLHSQPHFITNNTTITNTNNLNNSNNNSNGNNAVNGMAIPMTAKRPKSASADIYVPLCRAFSRPQVSAAQMYGLTPHSMASETTTSGDQQPLLPPPLPLTIDFILAAATKYEHFLPSTIESWQLALLHPQHAHEASHFVDSLMCSKDTAVKVIFSLLHCALFLQTPEGNAAWQSNYLHYRQCFQATLVHVVEQDSVKDEAKNQSLLATLPLAYFCAQKLMPRIGLRDNLCLFLALISCLEGRGKYHGRAGDNLPFAHKCYRYLVEILGGKIFRDIPESEQSKADKELSKLFESHAYSTLNSAANVNNTNIHHTTNTNNTNINTNSNTATNNANHSVHAMHVHKDINYSVLNSSSSIVHTNTNNNNTSSTTAHTAAAANRMMFSNNNNIVNNNIVNNNNSGLLYAPLSQHNLNIHNHNNSNNNNNNSNNNKNGAATNNVYLAAAMMPEPAALATS